MFGGSKRSFGHLECLNPSTIDAMAHCGRIRKMSHTENRQRMENRQRNQLQRPLYLPMDRQVEWANNQISKWSELNLITCSSSGFVSFCAVL